MCIIGINTLFIVPGRNRGVQTYLDNLIAQLAARGRFRFKLFVSEANEDHYSKIDKVELIRCPVEGNNRVFRVGYEQFCLQSLAKREGCDLVFFPGYLSPVWKQLPFVVTIPDTQFRDIPHLVPLNFRLLYNLIVPRSVKKADRVLTISEFSKSRLIANLGVAENQVTVAPLAAAQGEGPEEAASLEAITKLNPNLKGFDPEMPYLISVSSANPHKNVDKLVEAFESFNRRDQAFQLILVGMERVGDPERVFSTGFVSDQVRDELYRQAHGYVFPSKYEGFGLPLLEAMESGLPIASSKAASLPEVGGDACLYFDPDNLEEMTAALERLCHDDDLRAVLIKKGEAQLARFSWAKCAEITESVFAEVLDQRP